MFLKCFKEFQRLSWRWIVYQEPNATWCLYILQVWTLPDSQISWESKMELNVARFDVSLNCSYQSKTSHIRYTSSYYLDTDLMEGCLVFIRWSVTFVIIYTHSLTNIIIMLCMFPIMRSSVLGASFKNISDIPYLNIIGCNIIVLYL